MGIQLCPSSGLYSHPTRLVNTFGGELEFHSKVLIAVVLGLAPLAQSWHLLRNGEQLGSPSELVGLSFPGHPLEQPVHLVELFELQTVQLLRLSSSLVPA